MPGGRTGHLGLGVDEIAAHDHVPVAAIADRVGDPDAPVGVQPLQLAVLIGVDPVARLPGHPHRLFDRLGAIDPPHEQLTTEAAARAIASRKNFPPAPAGTSGAVLRNVAPSGPAPRNTSGWFQIREAGVRGARAASAKVRWWPEPDSWKTLWAEREAPEAPTYWVSGSRKTHRTPALAITVCYVRQLPRKERGYHIETLICSPATVINLLERCSVFRDSCGSSVRVSPEQARRKGPPRGAARPHFVGQLLHRIDPTIA